MIYNNIPTDPKINIGRILFLHIYDSAEEYDSMPAVREGSFWELLYAEKGLVDISAGDASHTLSKAGLFFRHPSETVHIHMQSPVPAKLISVGFSCTDTAMLPDAAAYSPSGSEAGSISMAADSAINLLCRKILPISSQERRLLRYIIAEITSCSGASPFAAGQAAMLYLQLLLISLLRNAFTDITLTPAPRSLQLEEEDELFRSIIEYMEGHIADRLTIEKICQDNLLGRAPLQKLFTDYTGCGVIDYFLLMKINAAKRLIRDGKWNLSQISEQLGYSSIHYFSRQFKNIAGTTPSEYAADVRRRQGL